VTIGTPGDLLADFEDAIKRPDWQMTRLGDLFPDAVSCVFSSDPPVKIDLLAGETKAAKTMRINRLREFAHGRACARRALAQLGIPACPIPVGDKRAPIWPEEIVGSISHCGQHAAAVAAYRTTTEGLGIDLETKDGLDRPLLDIVCRPEELLWLDKFESDCVLDKHLFSAKESLFKCVWPLLQRFIDFQEIEIRLNLAENTYTAIAHNSELPDALIKRVRGRCMQHDGLIITSAYLA
jgi:4'-phosphopantetheinyl transferase EntD